MIAIIHLFLPLILVLFFYSNAHAYIDPFTGGILYQIISAIFVALISAILFLGDKIKKMFHRVKSIFFKS